MHALKFLRRDHFMAFIETKMGKGDFVRQQNRGDENVEC